MHFVGAFWSRPKTSFAGVGALVPCSNYCSGRSGIIDRLRKDKDEMVLLPVLQSCNVAKSLLTEMHTAYIERVSVRYMTGVG